MNHIEKNIKRNPITQDDRDRLHQKDFENLRDGGATARMAIWAYVENDEPIPNELKPILQEILLEDFTGKNQYQTKSKWLTLVKEVAFQIQKSGDTIENAVTTIANHNNVHIDTLLKEYKSKKFRKLKDEILGIQN